NFDDTLKVLLRTGISGTYTVGGNNPDFVNFIDAVNFLNASGAICDTVFFNIRNGLYNGVVSINNLLGSNANRPVIFRPQNQNNPNVTIVDSIGSADTNYLVKFNGGDFQFFEKIVFDKHLVSTGRIFEFSEESNGK